MAEQEKKTLTEPTPGQPGNDGGYGEQSYTPAIESPKRHPQEGQHSNKIVEHPDKVDKH